VLLEILNPHKDFKHTCFVPSGKSSSGVKKWIGYSDGFAKGEVVINAGAVKALDSEKAVSLLPVGIVKVVSEFKKDDLIKIVDESGRQIGVGKAGYGSSKIETEKLAEKQRPLVHYDYLYLDNK
jgi:glutamate 5-kinase